MAKTVIKGLDQLERKLRGLPEVLERAARKTIKAETHEAAQDLRRLSPVLTGELRRSIQEELSKGGLAGAAVITDKKATFVIHGTSDTPANDFVTPVIQMIRRRFAKRLTDEVKAELRKL